jgi:flagellin
MFGDLTRVGANFHAMESWSNLKRVNGEIGQIQSRLSSGKRINSAEDDTSGYALSKHLESRGRGLSQALDNVGTAKNVLNIAEGGFQSQMSILQTMKEKATQAADGSFSTEQRGAIDDQFDALALEITDISNDTLFNDNALFGSTMTFQVGEGNGDTLSVIFDASNSLADAAAVAEVVEVVEVVEVLAADGSVTTAGVAGVTGVAAVAEVVGGIGEDGTDISGVDLSTQSGAQSAITTLDLAIKSLAKSIQKVGDYNARLSSKEESLSLAVSNTEATRSRIEDADFAKEQMSMMKLQILQQTSVSSFSQANAAPQMVLSLFR